ncbi:MAG: type II toxin-antitoxin system death-on-curing family toxin [Bdellovibrionales bacterium]|nr:type II toxin-antitoxin system death-on-curing family toxin [Bdellovibrionales bacterium]
MKVIFLPTADAVLAVNKYVCEQGGNPHHCYDVGKVESAISTAFYPGTYPFAHGGIAKVAGALCFYLVKSHAFMDGNKRTGALVAITFLNQHGLDLKYPLNEKKGINALADAIERCAASKLDKDKLMEWFEAHKVSIE